MNKQIEALLQERAGYVARKLPKRIESVDAALRELGFEHKYLTDIESTAINPETERAIPKKPKKRGK